MLVKHGNKQEVELQGHRYPHESFCEQSSFPGGLGFLQEQLHTDQPKKRPEPGYSR